MTTPRDPDEILSAWLDEGPTRLPDQTRRAIAVAIPTTSQRRRVSVPWRSTTMSNPFKLALGAAAVIAVVFGSAFLLGQSGSSDGVGGAPTPSPSPTASPTPSPSSTPAPSPSPVSIVGWAPFTSERYGYVMSHPVDSSSRAADRDWSLAVDQRDWLTSAADDFGSADGHVRIAAWAAPIPAGTSSDDWIAAYFGPDASGSPNPCPPLSVDLGPIAVDGHPATFRAEPDTEVCGGTYAFVPVGDRMHVFVVWASKNELLLEAYLSTVRFLPAATTPSASPNPS